MSSWHSKEFRAKHYNIMKRANDAGVEVQLDPRLVTWTYTLIVPYNTNLISTK